MGYFDPRRLRDPEERERREDVRLLLLVTEAQVRLGHAVPATSVGALERVAQDESGPARCQRRAAAVLAKIRLRGMALGLKA